MYISLHPAKKKKYPGIFANNVHLCRSVILHMIFMNCHSKADVGLL